MSISSTVKSALGKLSEINIGKVHLDDYLPHGGKSNKLWNYHEEAHKPLSFLPGTHYTVKKRYAVGIPLAWAGMSAGYELTVGTGEKYEEAKLGQIESGELVNSVNISRSATLDRYLERAQTPEQIEELRQNQNALQLRTGDATGDLVFALHNLREGGR